MTKSHQKAFNKAYSKILKSKDRKFLYNSKTKVHDVVVPIATVISEMKVFIKKVEKDLKIGQFKPKKRNERSGKANR